MYNGLTFDDNFWDVDTSSSSYTPANGAQRVIIFRKNPGVEEVKIGGATYIWLKFEDPDGSQQIQGSYFKWAEEDWLESGAAYLSSAIVCATLLLTAIF